MMLANPRLTSGSADGAVEATLVFSEVYQEHLGFVWRSARGLGVGNAAIDDVVQEIFVVVHRRLHEFAGRSTVRTWLSGIVLNVVRHHRRHVRRKSPHELTREEPADPDALHAPGRDPYEAAVQAEQARLVHQILEGIDDEKREVFVLVELEDVPVPEVAEALGIKLNTAYSRLRLAREEFERAVVRHQARERRSHA
jgi:RNA polymerase sigma-70 factor (ECF subfamily)